MRIFFCAIFFFLATGGWLRTAAQSLELSGSKVTLPEGDVLGVAFHEKRGMFFVQQSVFSTEKNGMVIRSRRQLSSWDLKNHSMLMKRLFDLDPAGAPAYSCRRVEVSIKMNKVLLCSAEAYLEVLDPDTLNTVGKIASRNDQHIYDFAVDDQRGRVFVLSLRGDSSPRLTSYSLLDGAQQQETALPPAPGARMMLALVEKTGQVALAVIDFHGREKSHVYICGSEAALGCASVALIDGLSQISLLGKTLLAATDASADHKKECLITIDLSTHSVLHEYCSPATGVHYAVAVADNKYIVGFTGTAKRVWWREENVSQESSFSVWIFENPKVAAVAKDPENFGAKQFRPSIFASQTEPLFVAHVGESNVLYVYSIVDHRHGVLQSQ